MDVLQAHYVRLVLIKSYQLLVTKFETLYVTEGLNTFY